MKSLLEGSVNESLAVQWITMVFNIFGLAVPVQSKDTILYTVLLLETFVQTIQLGFYSWFKTHIVSSPATITQIRYYDWVITTPLMLFTTIIFYKYNSQTEEEAEKQPLTLKSFLQQYPKETIAIVLFNLGMLIAGYLGEVRILGLVSSTILGFLAFGGTFYAMWDTFVKDFPQNNILYFFMLIVWAIYGIAALFNPVWKNISYNILDVFSKNFYGVFLSFYIFYRYMQH